MQRNHAVNRFCKDNGFKGSGEVCDLLGIHHNEIKSLFENNTIKLVDLVLKLKIERDKGKI